MCRAASFRCVGFVLVCWLVWGAPAAAQPVSVGDAFESYARLLQLDGQIPAYSFSVRPLPAAWLFGSVEEAHPWQQHLGRYQAPLGARGLRYGAFDPELRAYWNSERPSGQNDGAVWQGRGSVVALSAGGFVRYGGVTAAFRPQFIYTENLHFELFTRPEGDGLSPFAYTDTRIDMPQRFGEGRFTMFDLGQSFVRLDYRGAAVGFSNENLWWGPGVRNAILMSNHAPGFLHAFLGTAHPVDVWAGDLQGRWIWGRLHESGYFDTLKENDERFLTSIVLDFTPRWVPGLSFGLARSFIMNTYPDEPAFSDYFLVFQEFLKKRRATPNNPTGEDQTDQLASVFGRWLFPESGLEVYAEWARGDHSWDLRDFVVEPEHASGYTLGLQKAFRLEGNKRLRLTTELTSLSAPKTTLVRSRGAGFFYLHGIVQQGYTQRGQVLGAGIGPGSSSQFLGLDLFAPWGRAGFFAQRLAIDNDRYYNRPDPTNFQHEVEISFGLDGLVFFRGFEVGGGLTFGRLLNRFYVFQNDQSNVNLSFSVRRSLMGYR